MLPHPRDRCRRSAHRHRLQRDRVAIVFQHKGLDPIARKSTRHRRALPDRTEFIPAAWTDHERGFCKSDVYKRQLYNIVDSAFVARISEDALTAVSLAFPVQLLMIAVATGTGVGVNALLSRRLGQKRQEAANAVAVNGIFLSVCCWLVFAVLGLLFGRQFIALFTDVPEIIQMGTGYITVVSVASCGVFLLFVAERLMQATGNTVYHMVTQLIGAVLNCILDPIMIFGLFGFPALGTTGAALATVISQIIAMAIGFAINVHFNHDVRIHIRGFRPDGKILGEIVRIGLPAALQQSLMSVLTVGLNRILMPFSQTCLLYTSRCV